MKKDASVFLEDILKNIELIEKFTRNLSKEQFLDDEKTQYGVMHGIEIMGEATKNLGRDLTGRYKNVPWKDIAGMRDKLIHNYFGVNVEEVWIVAKQDLPELKAKIQKILAEVEREEKKG